MPIPRTLKYAYRAPNGLWNPTVTVDSKTNTGTYISIALQNVNKGTTKKPIIVQEPSIAYFAEATADLKLAESTDLGATWKLSVVASKGSVGLYPTLMYDSVGRATVTFYNRTTGDAFFGQLKEGVWHYETIDSVGDVGRDIVLSVNSAGQYAVAYSDTTNKAIKYAVQGKKGKWSTQVADSTTGGTKYLSLAQNSDFGPAISYFDLGKAELHLDYFRKGVWKRQVVATLGAPGSLFPRRIPIQRSRPSTPGAAIRTRSSSTPTSSLAPSLRPSSTAADNICRPIGMEPSRTSRS